VRISVKYTNINLDSFCIDQIIEICTIKLQWVEQNICIVSYLEIFHDS
jgi:hypothetical protein